MQELKFEMNNKQLAVDVILKSDYHLLFDRIYAVRQSTATWPRLRGDFEQAFMLLSSHMD